MPVGIGYAIDAKGVRHPNALCLRDDCLRLTRNIPMGHGRAIPLLGRGTFTGRDSTDRCRSDHRSNQSSHNNKIDRISETRRCQRKRIQAVGFQTRHVERNHHAHHSAQKVGGNKGKPHMKKGDTRPSVSGQESAGTVVAIAVSHLIGRCAFSLNMQIIVHHCASCEGSVRPLPTRRVNRYD